ncbi:NAD(P)/FAD-dependent oxidoreductase [Pedobacter sandarakinus]|uniref:NAD(P)/FAD-dependent oxidoreductase n=1 Tax=Pedobacter sandarakinus TaxID=353156 RepID=UPI002246FF80|nr:NAD(P)/FAD-dependent oxidoreductase [Pedobacter sandarakinus]MCX2573109.1 NAD(P)/FAD-dependent oxidoreductase [Pedobacter sandarakinus]
MKTEILIIGGGLAGLTAALHLQKLGISVIIIEKKSYPHHKVCGEYISNEVLPYFDWLNLNLDTLFPTTLTTLQVTSADGGKIDSQLPLGGFGLSRYTIDNYLYQVAVARGVPVLTDTVLEINFSNDQFVVETSGSKTFNANHVIGAYGKRSHLDTKLNRAFMRKKSEYLGVKAHYQSDYPNHIVSLHNFKGGYCGASKVEGDILNLCYLADYQSFKQYKNIESYQEQVIYKNPSLKKIFENATMLFDAPITISQISFEPKTPVHNHILMVGDTAGLINPLCGNGMAMAIHSAKIACICLMQYLNHTIPSRLALENTYTNAWQKEFGSRLRAGRILASLMRNQKIEKLAMNTLTKMPFLLNTIIKKTHGKPITIPN